jgi:hypothetical protein
MVMLITDGSLCWFKRPALWHIDAVGGRPPHLAEAAGVRASCGWLQIQRYAATGAGRGRTRAPSASTAATRQAAPAR